MKNPVRHKEKESTVGRAKDLRAEELMAVFFISVIVFPVLYLMRSVDSNTLTSWRWLFTSDNFITINVFIISGIIISYFASNFLRNERFATAILVLLPFAMTVPMWQEPEVIIDASRYFLQAKHLGLYGISSFFKEWGKDIFAWTDLPLMPFAYGMIFRYLGESRIFIQIFNSILFASTVMLTYLIGKDFINKETGIFGGLLLLGMPYLFTQTPLMLVDVPAMFIFMLASYTFLKATSSGSLVMILISSLSIFLAVFSKYSVWLILTMLPVIAFAANSDDLKKTVLRSAVICVIAMVMAAVLIALKYDVFHEQIRLLFSYQRPGLKKWEEGVASTFFFQSHPFIIILAAIGSVAAIMKKDKRFLIAGWAVFFIIALQINRIRYLIPFLPFIALMASYGLNIIKGKRLRWFAAFCIVTYSFVISVFGFLPFLNKTSASNLKHAGAYIDSLEGDYLEVLALPQGSSTGSTVASLPLLDLFTKKKIIYKQSGMQEDAGELQMRSPLRFTWEMKMPRFYTDGGSRQYPIVAVISGESIERPLSSLGMDKHSNMRIESFRTDNAAYRYRTFVSVLTTESLSGKEH